MTPAFAYGKSGAQHAYYVSLSVQRADKPRPGTISRVSAPAARMRVLTAEPDADWGGVVAHLRRAEVRADGLMVHLASGILGLGDPNISQSRFQARLDAGDRLFYEQGLLQLFIATRPVFRGGRTWMVQPEGVRPSVAGKPDPQLIKALAQAHTALADHDAAPGQSLEAWGSARAIADSYLRRATSIAFLAPDIQMAILEGRQAAGLTAHQLAKQNVPLAWADQRRLLGIER